MTPHSFFCPTYLALTSQKLYCEPYVSYLHEAALILQPHYRRVVFAAVSADVYLSAVSADGPSMDLVECLGPRSLFLTRARGQISTLADTHWVALIIPLPGSHYL